MPTGMLISVEEYLATSYRPDCDYVEGQVEERNLGERDHSNLQMIVSAYLFARRKQWDIQVYPEQRVQVKPNRFRIPDICVVLGATEEQIFTTPPFLCIEILSPEDRMSRVQERIDDYLAMGDPTFGCWIPALVARSPPPARHVCRRLRATLSEPSTPPSKCRLARSSNNYGENMSTGKLISLEEYLTTSYRPDCDYIDGRIEERNLGELDHSRLQTAVVAYFWEKRKKWGILVLLEQRVQVKPNRFRIADICVVVGETDEQILTKPPFLCVEILSPEDRLSRVLERIDDYLALGVHHVWLLDPGSRSAYVCTAAEGLREIKTGILKTENPTLEVPLRELFDE